MCCWHSKAFYTRDTTMADKFMYIPNDYTQNYPFCRLKLVAEMFKHSTLWNIQLKFMKVPKVVDASYK